MELEKIQEMMAQFLQGNEIPAAASWPDGDRRALQGAMVLVSLVKMNCESVGLQDYLGERLDETTGQVTQWYGRKAKLEFALDILAPAVAGAEVCRELFGKLVEVLQSKRPDGLTVRKLSGEDIKFDQKEGLLRLHCVASCDGWLWASGDEAADILDFTLRGDWNR